MKKQIAGGIVHELEATKLKLATCEQALRESTEREKAKSVVVQQLNAIIDEARYNADRIRGHLQGAKTNANEAVSSGKPCGEIALQLVTAIDRVLSLFHPR